MSVIVSEWVINSLTDRKKMQIEIESQLKERDWAIDAFKTPAVNVNVNVESVSVWVYVAPLL